jgi:2-polyprenyl-3-methyl-5-hydroxy-6-metoxy-1,4-benzoquinol methylase
VTDESRSLWDREALTFDDAADHGLRDPTIRRAWADLLLPLAGDPGRRVADLGCGTGTLSVLLAAVQPLDDPSLWGGPIDDERYLIVSRR